MSNNSNDTVVIKYNSKEYEIKKTKDEQKVLPKGQVRIETGDNPDEITVKDYEEKTWNTTAVINGSQVEVKWGSGKYITFIGLPAILAMILLVGVYIWYKNKKTEAEERSL